MPSVKLTDRSLRSLPPGEYWDEIVQGFGLRVSPKGKRSYFVRFRLGKQQRRQKLGTYPDVTLAEARTAAREAMRAPAPKRSPVTFLDVVRGYVARREAAGNYSYEYARLLRAELSPRFEGVLAEAIRRRDVTAFFDELVDRDAGSVADKIRSLILASYGWALGREMVETNPLAGLPKPWWPTARDRTLNDEEIKLFWKATEGLAVNFRGVMRMILLTGQRTQEVRLMQWKHVSSDWWLIPPENLKQRRTHRVFLSPQAAAQLEFMRGLGLVSPFVFPSFRKLSMPVHAHTVVRQMMGIEDAIGGNVHAHDLRRSCASGMARIGVQRFIVARVLGHSDGSITATYDRYSYDAEIKEALTKWGAHVESVTQPSAASRSTPASP